MEPKAQEKDWHAGTLAVDEAPGGVEKPDHPGMAKREMDNLAAETMPAEIGFGGSVECLWFPTLLLGGCRGTPPDSLRDEGRTGLARYLGVDKTRARLGEAVLQASQSVVRSPVWEGGVERCLLKARAGREAGMKTLVVQLTALVTAAQVAAEVRFLQYHTFALQLLAWRDYARACGMAIHPPGCSSVAPCSWNKQRYKVAAAVN